MVFIGHIFYFIGLLVFIMNLNNLLNSRKLSSLIEWSISFNKVTKKIVSKDDLPENDFKLVQNYSNSMVITFAWMILGLITNSWLIFLSLISINFLMNFIRNNTPFKFIQFFIMCFINVLVIGFTFINHFHLHIDVYKFLF
jgi:hypothetical protein